MTRVRSNEVAATAYQVVVAHQGDGKKRKKKYGALAHKLPVLILQNGLAQATGFLLAKGETEHLALLDDLTKVLRDTGTTQSQTRDNLHQEIIAANLAKTMILTRRSLEATGWIKRYVQGVLGVDSTGDSNRDDPEPMATGTEG